jgi:hypothetical protein
MLLVKIFALLGVLSNFFGSLMLLRDFRDIMAIPFHRWRLRSLETQINAYLKKNGVGVASSVVRNPASTAWPVRQFGVFEILRAGEPLRDFMRLSNEHYGFRKSLGLKPLSITDPFSFNIRSTQRSFREINAHLDEWAAEPDPESSTDRSRALKFFIGGFALLTMAALLDLLLYIVGAA